MSLTQSRSVNPKTRASTSSCVNLPPLRPHLRQPLDRRQPRRTHCSRALPRVPCKQTHFGPYQNLDQTRNHRRHSLTTIITRTTTITITPSLL